MAYGEDTFLNKPKGERGQVAAPSKTLIIDDAATHVALEIDTAMLGALFGHFSIDVPASPAFAANVVIKAGPDRNNMTALLMKTSAGADHAGTTVSVAAGAHQDFFMNPTSHPYLVGYRFWSMEVTMASAPPANTPSRVKVAACIK